jgi:hypothetical protein
MANERQLKILEKGLVLGTLGASGQRQEASGPTSKGLTSAGKTLAALTSAELV